MSGADDAERMRLDRLAELHAEDAGARRTATEVDAARAEKATSTKFTAFDPVFSALADRVLEHAESIVEMPGCAPPAYVPSVADAMRENRPPVVVSVARPEPINWGPNVNVLLKITPPLPRGPEFISVAQNDMRDHAMNSERASSSAGSVDYESMTGGDMLKALGDNAMKWAEAFCQIKAAKAWTIDDIDESLMVGWFANAIESSYDIRRLRSEMGALAKAEAERDDARDRALSKQVPLATYEKDINEMSDSLGAVIGEQRAEITHLRAALAKAEARAESAERKLATIGGLLRVLATGELVPESVSYMRAAIRDLGDEP